MYPWASPSPLQRSACDGHRGKRLHGAPRTFRNLRLRSLRQRSPASLSRRLPTTDLIATTLGPQTDRCPSGVLQQPVPARRGPSLSALLRGASGRCPGWSPPELAPDPITFDESGGHHSAAVTIARLIARCLWLVN